MCKQDFLICTTLLFESYQKLQIISIPNRFKSIFSWVNWPCMVLLRILLKKSGLCCSFGQLQRQRVALTPETAWRSCYNTCAAALSTALLWSMTRWQRFWAKIPQGILMSGCDYQLTPHVFLIGAALVWESHPASWNGLGARPVHNLCGRCNFFDQPFFNWLAQTPPKSWLLYRVFSLWLGILAARFGFVVCITMERVCSRKWVYQMIRWHVFPSHHR